MYSIFNDLRNWDQVKYVIYEYVIEYMGQKYSRMDKVNFLKAAFHKSYLVHSKILCHREKST